MKHNAQRGFSLIEIMVVVVILGILAALVVPKIVNRPDEARIVKARQDVLAVQNALELYKLDNGFYPSTDQGLKALVEKPSSSPIPQDWKAYLKKVPKDPWGSDYIYLNPGQHGDIDIYTNGADGQPGGEGVNAEIGNWNAG
ncbi:MAG: type II secretion system major pseudopilin GspG [Gammaproteobacteria bacterium]|nr:type II secretion system major pseudopilin GspG [Gammaproteobacteria bacterium]